MTVTCWGRVVAALPWERVGSWDWCSPGDPATTQTASAHSATWCAPGRDHVNWRNVKTRCVFCWTLVSPSDTLSEQQTVNSGKCDLYLKHLASLCLCCHKQYNLKVWWKKSGQRKVSWRTNWPTDGRTDGQSNPYVSPFLRKGNTKCCRQGQIFEQHDKCPHKKTETAGTRRSCFSYQTREGAAILQSDLLVVVRLHLHNVPQTSVAIYKQKQLWYHYFTEKGTMDKIEHKKHTIHFLCKNKASKTLI